MSEYYTPQRKRNMYDPESSKPFKLSRSKIDLFMKCKRCFYIDRRLGVATPPGYPFNLNSAVDALLKNEFDYYREKGAPHPLIEKNGINAIPFKHPDMDSWRDAMRRGIQFLHAGTNLMISGGIDDVWIDQDGWLHIVDYKATSKKGEVDINSDWQVGYKRQIEIYQWLFRRNGFKVSDTAYFVYCNGDSSLEKFNSRLEFDIKVIPYVGNDIWVEDAIYDIRKCLSDKEAPAAGDCDYCNYIKAINEISLCWRDTREVIGKDK